MIMYNEIPNIRFRYDAFGFTLQYVDLSVPISKWLQKNKHNIISRVLSNRSFPKSLVS